MSLNASFPEPVSSWCCSGDMTSCPRRNSWRRCCLEAENCSSWNIYLALKVMFIFIVSFNCLEQFNQDVKKSRTSKRTRLTMKALDIRNLRMKWLARKRMENSQKTCWTVRGLACETAMDWRSDVKNECCWIERWLSEWDKLRCSEAKRT